MADQTSKRPYRRESDWRDLYRQAEDNSEPITHQWYIIQGFCKTEVAARKVTERHVERGILYRKGTGLIQTFGLLPKVNNVTGYSVNPIMAVNVENRQVQQLIAINNPRSNLVDFDKNRGSVVPIQPIKEHSVCNKSSSKDRVRDHRKRQKVNNITCTCTPAITCDTCYWLRVNNGFTTYHALHAPAIHPLLLKFPDGRYIHALQAFDTSHLLAHNTYAEFYTIPPSEAELGPHRNRAIRGKLMLYNIPVNYERYKGGKVVIKPRLSKTPILPEKMGVFMDQVRKLLPFESPPVDTWRITHTDFHFQDSPTEEKAKRYITFDHNGTHFVAYNKNLPTGRALRLEAQVVPTVTLKDYPAAVERARQKLLEVLGK